jgi:hypothetical protein
MLALPMGWAMLGELSQNAFGPLWALEPVLEAIERLGCLGITPRPRETLRPIGIDTRVLGEKYSLT